jgi:hypothetical protein
MDSDLERALRCAHFSSERCIWSLGSIEKERLQPVEMVQASMLYALGPESVHDSVEDRERPAPLEDPLRRLGVRRLALITILGGRDFKGQDPASAAFLRATAIGFVGVLESAARIPPRIPESDAINPSAEDLLKGIHISISALFDASGGGASPVVKPDRFRGSPPDGCLAGERQNCDRGQWGQSQAGERH